MNIVEEFVSKWGLDSQLFDKS